MNAASNSILFFDHLYYIVIRSNADATQVKNVSLKINFAACI
jgi:hypothetical protein